jgi:hypothetical protein
MECKSAISFQRLFRSGEQLFQLLHPTQADIGTHKGCHYLIMAGLVDSIVSNGKANFRYFFRLLALQTATEKT